MKGSQYQGSDLKQGFTNSKQVRYYLDGDIPFCLFSRCWKCIRAYIVNVHISVQSEVKKSTL
jgi:hypothetical protein